VDPAGEEPGEARAEIEVRAETGPAFRAERIPQA